MAPGSRLLAFASQWFDEGTVARVFEPLLADYQREWATAPRPRQYAITTRTTAAFIASAIALSPRALLLTPAPPPMLRRILARMIIFSSAACLLLMLPFLLELRAVSPARLALLLALLQPSVLVLVFPFASAFVVDGIRRQLAPSPPERIAALRVAIGMAVFLVVLGGWIVPAANQQFRETIAPAHRQPLARGIRELTTYELIASPAAARASEQPYASAAALTRELNQRASLAVLPVVLVWLRWRALRFRSPQWLPTWLATLATFVAYLIFRWNDTAIESASLLPIGAGAWVPLAVFVMAGFTRDYFARRRLT